MDLNVGILNVKSQIFEVYFVCSRYYIFVSPTTCIFIRLWYINMYLYE